MGVSYLLDTHVLLWLVGDPTKVPTEVQSQLADPQNQLLASVVSALEIATKSRLGKLDASELIAHWDSHIEAIGAHQLNITACHALRAGSMTWDHRDPFDRLLVAQTLTEGATLVTADTRIRRLDALPLLAW